VFETQIWRNGGIFLSTPDPFSDAQHKGDLDDEISHSACGCCACGCIWQSRQNRIAIDERDVVGVDDEIRKISRQLNLAPESRVKTFTLARARARTSRPSLAPVVRATS
jgi:hypothetical protein